MTRLHDAVIEHLALDEAALRERVAELEAERATYRALLQQALDQLHELAGRELTRRRRVDRLLDEIRRLRATRAAA